MPQLQEEVKRLLEAELREAEAGRVKESKAGGDEKGMEKEKGRELEKEEKKRTHRRRSSLCTPSP
jgi:hypothetical protein